MRPAASSCSITASRWPTERARRSSRTTTRVSQARQHGAAATGAGGVLLEDRGAAGGAQFVELRIGALVVDGDAGVADQPAAVFQDFVPRTPPSWQRPERVGDARENGLAGRRSYGQR